MIYGSVCSGIEAATAAWHPLGWMPSFFSEIEPFPKAVLAHHYPKVKCHGDFTTIQTGDYRPIDLLVGGTPCQSFSVGGLRGGLGDDRGNLALEYIRLADRLRPRWLVWENVPGVLSSNGGRDFGSILGGMGELGYGVAYRVLDAVHFGVPQQRRRVFVVASVRGWQSAAAALFERDSFSGRPTPRQPAAVSVCITRRGPGSLDDRETYIVEGSHPRHMTPLEIERCFGFPDGYTDLSQESPFARSQGSKSDGTIRHQPSGLRRDVDQPRREVRSVQWPNGQASGGSLPLDGAGQGHPLSPLQHQATSRRGHGLGYAGVGIPRKFRRIADGPRYKALGNSMAVPVMAWIGRRIEQVEAALQENTP